MRFFDYLLHVSCCAREYELTKLRYEAAKERAARVSTPSFEPIARSGAINYDSIAHRVAVLEVTREDFKQVSARCGRVLKMFRGQLEACLSADGANALWMKYAQHLDNREIARRLDMDPRHVWPMLKDARDALCDFVGDEVPDSYLG